jgi:putative ABC transport system substrate-binding protein
MSMRRRKFITLLGGASAWPLVARAQAKLPVVGWLSARPRVRGGAASEGIVEGLRDAGFVEGQDVIIDYRSADDQFDRLPALAAELVERRVSVIAAPGSMALAAAARGATSTIPIVFMIGSDPVELGLVKSFNRPGGNLTGVAFSRSKWRQSGSTSCTSLCLTRNRLRSLSTGKIRSKPRSRFAPRRPL